MIDISNTNRITDAIYDFLKQQNITASFDAENQRYEFDMWLYGKIRMLHYSIVVNQDDYMVLVNLPVGVRRWNASAVQKMAEFICKRNWTQKNGNFDFNMENGEIRFKYYVDCSGIRPTQEMIKHSIHCPASMFSLYGERMLDIIAENEKTKGRRESPMYDNSEFVFREMEDDDMDVDKMISRIETRFGNMQ